MTPTAGRRVGIDIGGTFTDLFVVEADGTGSIYKAPTTPEDPSIGLLDGLRMAAQARRQDLRSFLAEVSTIVHGTTIATNAVLTRSGARTGFVTTKGFRDLLNMRRGIREHQNNSKYSPPQPLVERRLIHTVDERVNASGAVVTELDEEQVRQVARQLREEGVESVAVSYLWSFLHPEHELRTKEILEEELPEAYVTLSNEVLPQIRAYERHSTTALNAYVGPKLKDYLANIEGKLQDEGFDGTLLIVQSNGGVMSPEAASQKAVSAVLSGPAAAPGAALQYTAEHGSDKVITVDMGGTSFDVALVNDGTPLLTTDSEIGGYRVALPMLDIHTVGAGGGSLVRVDSGGMLRVGPESATAVPGPACYGRGGTRPTVTDADLLMGYLNPDLFGDGAFTLDVEASLRAVREHVAEPLGLSMDAAIEGIYRVVNATMAEAVNEVSVKRGFDPREFTMVVAGGAGPVHAVPIAAELGIGRIIVPRESSVFCAVGTLLTDLKHMYARTIAADIDKLDLERINQILRQLIDEATATLIHENVPEEQIDLQFSVDLRYVGQFEEVEVPLVVGQRLTQEDVDQATAAFHVLHEEMNGYAMPGEQVELINVRVVALGHIDKPTLREQEPQGPDPEHARATDRVALVNGERREVPVYDGLALVSGNRVVGPAIVEQPTTTIVVSPGYDLTVDRGGNYVIEPLN